MFKKSFKRRVMYPSMTILAILTISLIFYSSVKLSEYSHLHIGEKVNANINSLKLYIENSKTYSRAAAISMALNSNAIQAVKKQDKNEIIRVFTPFIALYGINYFTITDNEGNVLVRTYDSELFGDSIINQQNIQDALKGKVSTYIEGGTAIKVSVRTGAPVYGTDGQLLGVISAGVRLDSESTLDELKKQLNADVTVFSGNTRVATTIVKDGMRITGTTMDPAVAKNVLGNKQEYFGDLTIFGNKYKVFYMPLLNNRNEPFAAFFLGTPLTELHAQLSILIWDEIIIGFTGLIVSVILLSFIISSITDSVIMLPKDVDLDISEETKEKQS